MKQPLPNRKARRAQDRGKGTPDRDIARMEAAYRAGDLATAGSIAQTLVARHREHPAGWRIAGFVLMAQARFADALGPFAEWMRLAPHDADAPLHCGNALMQMGRLVEAGSHFFAASKIRPDFALAHNNMAIIFQALGRHAEALASAREAIRLQPDMPEAWNNLANIHNELAEFEPAIAAYDRALALRPDFTVAHSNMLFAKNYLQAAAIAEAVADARRFGQAVSAAARPKLPGRISDKAPASLRIGVVSGDLNSHPVGFFLEPLLRGLDRTRFETFAFPTRHHADAMTETLRPLFHHWVPIHALADRDAAQAIHRLGIDILIDLSGHTWGNRLAMFAYRPAPVQVSWLGYFATTGVPEIDYFLGDPHLLPAGSQAEFTERAWPLPASWFCMGPIAGAPPVAPPPCLAKGHVTFGSLGKLAKVNARVVATWARVLHAVPGAQLLIKASQLGDAAAADTVRARFAAHAIGADRLLLEGPSPRADYFSAYDRVDIVLDTFPYPGGTTSVEALWMGAPVLTMRGDRFLARLGESIAINADRRDWIADDSDDYVARAARHAADPAALATLRADARVRLAQTALFDTVRFAADFGDTLCALWRDRIGG